MRKGEVSVQEVQRALTEAGLEIYSADDDELQIAERVRLHIMDSGVRVRISRDVAVCFTARMQRSDAPSAPPEELFERVREHIGAQATTRGYAESGAHITEVKDPMDANKILDVWHEVTYQKTMPAVIDMVDEVRWALGVDKFVPATPYSNSAP